MISKKFLSIFTAHIILLLITFWADFQHVYFDKLNSTFHIALSIALLFALFVVIF